VISSNKKVYNGQINKEIELKLNSDQIIEIIFKPQENIIEFFKLKDNNS